MCACFLADWGSFIFTRDGSHDGTRGSCVVMAHTAQAARTTASTTGTTDGTRDGPQGSSQNATRNGMPKTRRRIKFGQVHGASVDD